VFFYIMPVITLSEPMLDLSDDETVTIEIDGYGRWLLLTLLGEIHRKGLGDDILITIDNIADSAMGDA